MEAAWRDPLPVQERALRALVGRARDTVWGREHGYREIRGIADYQRRVPVTTYLDVRLLIERAIGGEQNVLWPGRPAEYCKTSGTTAGDKYIPVTREALRAHRQGGIDALLLALRRVGRAEVLDGPMLLLGGSTRMEPLGRHAEVGDLSGLAARRLPVWIRQRYAPGPEIAAIPDWERRLAATARLARHQDLRLISGMPSWMLVLFERIRSLAEDPACCSAASGPASRSSSTAGSGWTRTGASSRPRSGAPFTTSRCIQHRKASWRFRSERPIRASP